MNLRRHLIDAPYSPSQRARRRRLQVFTRMFPNLESMNVLDMGGTEGMWIRAGLRPKSVTLLNKYAPSRPAETPGFIDALGDACNPPEEIRSAGFDLVFSNSVIEHVGGFLKRQEFAEAVRQCAPRYWIQTPNRYFPVEPHYLFPGLQFLPLEARAAIVQRWPLVPRRLRTPGDALRSVTLTDLIGRAEFARLFPDGEIISERVGPLSKSFVAVKTQV